MRPNESGTTRVSMSRTIASLNDLRIFVTRSSADSITFDTIRKRSKPCFIPFFKLDVELFMRTYIAGVFFAASALRVSLLDAGVIGVILGLISIGFSLAFVYVGFTLPKLLRGSASRIVTLLYASAGWTVFFFLLSLLGGPSTFGLVTLILTLLILWYLLKNVRRLAAEAQAAPSEPPPSGTC